MALVKFGAGIVAMAGSIAGTVFARNRYGAYARARTVPTNPKTDRQNDVRAAVAYLADRWAQTLTNAQRQAWNLYGNSVNMKNRLGETIHLSGYNHYIRSNTFRKAGGFALVDAGPVVFELPAQDPTLAITASEADQEITCTFDNTMDWATEALAYIWFYQGQPQNAQRNFFAGPWRYLHGVGGVDPEGAISPKVAAVQFGIAELQRQWVYARISRADGRLSEIFRADCFVAANGV
ncbi:hypothetical protein ES703_67893 [subsurface metagenome]